MKRLLTPILSFFALISAGQPGATTPSACFNTSASSYTFPLPMTLPSFGASDDFNGDGKFDMMYANGVNTVAVAFGDGAGKFNAGGSTYTTGFTGTDITWVAVADLDNDTRVDIATGLSNGVIVFFWNNGSGGFSTKTSLNIVHGTDNFTLIDHNKDLMTDLVITQKNTGRYTVLTNTGSRSFSYSTYTGFSYPDAIAAGDFNNDNNPDLAIAHNNGVVLLAGNGAGIFTRYDSLLVFTKELAIADMDTNGTLDLVTATNQSVSIYEGNGIGAFANPRTIMVTHIGMALSTIQLKIKDANADGKPDVLISSQSADLMIFLLNAGNLDFEYTKYATGNDPVALVTNDFNTDGLADFITINYFGESYSIGFGEPAGRFRAAVYLDSKVGAWLEGEKSAAADFNGDGSPDLAVVSDSLQILLNNGAGALTIAHKYKGGNNPTGLTLADINQDGITDIVTANRQSKDLSIFRGNGNGTFQAAAAAVVGDNSCYDVSSGRFNNDNFPDLVVTDYTALKVFLNNGGLFTTYTELANTSFVEMVKTADFNKDGFADLIAVSTYHNNVKILLNTGTGTFSTPLVFSMCSNTYIPSLVVSDLNGDGNLDFGMPDFSCNYGRYFIHLGDGAGAFSSSYTILTGHNAERIYAADINFDTYPDLLSIAAFDDNIRILFNNGNGGWHSTTAAFKAGGYVNSLSIADFNLDGKPDLATTNFYSETAAVLFNNTVKIVPSGNIVLCAGQSIALTVADTGTYTWSNGTTGNPILVSSPGTYKVLTTSTTGKCAASSMAIVSTSSITATPVSFTVQPSTVCNDVNAITLQATPAGGTFYGSGITGNQFDPGSVSNGQHVLSYQYISNGCTSSDTASIGVDICTGIAEAGSNTATIYPNPVDGLFNITVDDARGFSVDIYNPQGKLIYSGSSNCAHAQLSLAGMDAGLYMVKILIEEGAIVKKILKQ